MLSELVKPARVAVETCMGVKEGEEVLIITDEYEYEIGYALFIAAKMFTKHANLMLIYPRTRHGEEPDKCVAEAMRAADVVLAPTFYSLSHTEARRIASKQGVRIATLPGIKRETFLRALNVDYNKVKELSEKVAELLSKARKARVVTPSGTDIELELGNPAKADTGIYVEPGAFGNLPAGEAYLAPVNANGKIFVDHWGPYEKVGVIVVKGGFAVSMPDKIMEVFKEAEKVDGKNVYMIAELGIGTNPGAKLSGSVLEDEKVLGTVHIAFGSNASFPGGKNRVSIHEDFILVQPTLWLDGRKIIENGKLLL